MNPLSTLNCSAMMRPEWAHSPCVSTCCNSRSYYHYHTTTLMAATLHHYKIALRIHQWMQLIRSQLPQTNSAVQCHCGEPGRGSADRGNYAPTHHVSCNTGSAVHTAEGPVACPLVSLAHCSLLHRLVRESSPRSPDVRLRLIGWHPLTVEQFNS